MSPPKGNVCDDRSPAMSIELTANIRSLAPAPQKPALLSKAELKLRGGEITCLIGPSGAGKTSLLRLLAGDRSLYFEGDIIYSVNGEQMTVHNAARLGRIGLFLPDTGLPPWQSVEDILSLPARLNPRLLRPSRESVVRTLATVALPDTTLCKAVPELSHGMRHRVLLALALLYRPKFLFIDELLSSIDSPTVDKIIPTLTEFVKTEQSVCLLATHDLDRAAKLGDTFYFKNNGTSLTRLNQLTNLRDLFT